MNTNLRYSHFWAILVVFCMSGKCHGNTQTNNLLEYVEQIKEFLRNSEVYNGRNDQGSGILNLTLKIELVASFVTPLGIRREKTKIRAIEILNKVTSTIQESSDTVWSTETASEDMLPFFPWDMQGSEPLSTASPSLPTPTQSKRPRNCTEVQNVQGGRTTSGVYMIHPYESDKPENDKTGIEVYCDLQTDTGGWTLIQRRIDQTNFARTWKEYSAGFGNVSGSYWLGLNAIHELTRHGAIELRVDLEDWEGNTRYARYATFQIDGPADKFRLHLGSYSGNAGDSMTSNHNGMRFSTMDQDNDMDSGYHCASRFKAGWWFKNCHDANLNGVFQNENDDHLDGGQKWHGIIWAEWLGPQYSYKRAEMKIRTADYRMSVT